MSNDNMWNILDNESSEGSSFSEGAMDAIYRPAFPNYKVYIYGQEVSPDVLSVRVNQSGGSLERMPSTVSISIANRYEKYILTHEDMIYIGAYKNAVKKGLEPEQVNLSYSPEKFGYEYSNPIAGRPKFAKSGQLLSQLMGRSPTSPIGNFNISPDVMSELVTRLKNSSVEEARYTIEAFFSNLDGSNKYTESSFRGLTNDQLDSLSSKLKQAADQGDFDDFEEWNEEELPFNVKKEVIEKKLFGENVRQTATAPSNQGSTAVKETEGIIFDFPMQEGDFIFNLNDPVRVAFRDPFNPKQWYWQFTGFIDTWTEEVGPNLDSVINVTCTDVTKMARYALTNIRPGLVDVNLEDLLEQLNQSGSKDVNQAGLVLVQNVFEGLTVLEILELTFFGYKSAIELIESSRSSYVSVIDQFEEDDVQGLLSFMITTLNLSLDQAKEYLYNKSGDNRTLEDTKKKLTDYINTVRGEKQISRLNTLEWQGITSPRNIEFKRKSGLDTGPGVDFRVWGDLANQEEVSASDKSFGATLVKDFHTWNEQIHHRVKKSDLISMSVDNKSDENPANYTIEQVIHIIGTNLEKYPVGNGRVYYFAPAGMSDLLGDGIVNKAMGGVESFHSVFKDRLTMLYDIAESLEWRFYATPKGDIVMEHPFYDFDPQEFFESKSLSTNLNDTTKNFFERYDSVFGDSYRGTYSNPEELTEMVFELNTTSQALITYIEEPEFNYERMFTVGIDEQISFSNTNTDKGLVTVYRAKPHLIKLLPDLNVESARQFVYAIDKTLVPTLGFRLQDGNLQEYVSSEDGAKIYCALRLNQTNAEARNLGLETIPKFGLMVNRPMLWRYRNYYCNIVSCSHSIAWNSDVSTSINVNQIRAWSGIIEEGAPKYYHFGDNDRPFNWANVAKRSFRTNDTKKQQGQDQG